jgi:hypothetical protein
LHWNSAFSTINRKAIQCILQHSSDAHPNS